MSESLNSADPISRAIEQLDNQAAFDQWREYYALDYEPLTLESRAQDCKAAWDARGARDADRISALEAEVRRLQAELERKP